MFICACVSVCVCVFVCVCACAKWRTPASVLRSRAVVVTASNMLAAKDMQKYQTPAMTTIQAHGAQRVHVGIWYIFGP